MRLGTVTEPGWYVDYENPKQMRYHDGAAWTDYVHADRKNLPGAPVAPGVVQDTGAEPTEAGATGQDAPWVRLVSAAVLGLFVGFMLGAFLFNGLGAITPTTETSGTVDRVEIEYDQQVGEATRESHVLFGTTAAGEPWRIVDETAYNVLQAEGYPQQVTLAIGDWTGTPERVTGQSFVVDHQTSGARIGWAAIIGFIALAGLVAAYFTARAKSGGPLAAILFLVFLLGPGSWLGYQGVQWIQSG